MHIPLVGAAAIATPIWLMAPVGFGIQLAVPRLYKIAAVSSGLMRMRTLVLVLGAVWLDLGVSLAAVKPTGWSVDHEHWPLSAGIAMTIALLAGSSASAFTRAQTEVLRTKDAGHLLDSLELLHHRLQPHLDANEDNCAQTRMLIAAARRGVHDRAGAEAVLLVKDAGVTLRQRAGDQVPAADAAALDFLLEQAAAKVGTYRLRR